MNKIIFGLTLLVTCSVLGDNVAISNSWRIFEGTNQVEYIPDVKFSLCVNDIDLERQRMNVSAIISNQSIFPIILSDVHFSGNYSFVITNHHAMNHVQYMMETRGCSISFTNIQNKSSYRVEKTFELPTPLSYIKAEMAPPYSSWRLRSRLYFSKKSQNEQAKNYRIDFEIDYQKTTDVPAQKKAIIKKHPESWDEPEDSNAVSQ